MFACLLLVLLNLAFLMRLEKSKWEACKLFTIVEVYYSQSLIEDEILISHWDVRNLNGIQAVEVTRELNFIIH